MNIFNAAEVIDMGIEKEKKRRDFYAKVAETFSEKKMKDLFSRLRDWEETHIRKFGGIRRSVDESEQTEKYPGELRDYINTLVDDKLYAEVSADSFGRNVSSAADAVRYGMDFEKDAILFFSELLPYVRSPHKTAIQQLIDEEKQHLVYLSKLRNELQSG